MEYPYGHAYRYDGISEWNCAGCGVRYGRWSQRKLLGKTSEMRFGGKARISRHDT